MHVRFLGEFGLGDNEEVFCFFGDFGLLNHALIRRFGLRYAPSAPPRTSIIAIIIGYNSPLSKDDAILIAIIIGYSYNL